MTTEENLKDTDINPTDYYFLCALLAAERSKDPVTQVGACIVKKDKILGIGYNCMPKGLDDGQFSWGKSQDVLKNKSSYVCHAELNAIVNSQGRSLEGSTIYVTLFPCKECAKNITQSGIEKVVYLSDKHAEKETTKASKKILDSVGITYSQHESKKKIILEFPSENIKQD